MAVNIIRGASDDAIAQVAGALQSYAAAHPRATVDVYRQSRFSIKVRIVDPSFTRMPMGDRHDLVWPILDPLPDDLVSDITTLILLAPDEVSESLANFEFDHPVPQVLL